VTMVVGSQWGDEGKGKLVDYLTNEFDICARCAGGNNAGHTIVVEGKKFDFHLLPSGVVHKTCQNVIGNGCVIHIPALFSEIDTTVSKGVVDCESRILVSDRAHIVFDVHQAVDGLQEEHLGGDKIGTTKKGIGPCYSSKAARDGIRIGDLRFQTWKDRFRKMVHNYKIIYGDKLDFDVEAEIARYDEYTKRLAPMICDTAYFVNKAFRDGKKILIEGANAIMIDLDFGTYPFVTSSSTGCNGASPGLGLSPNKITNRFGVVKAYTTRVGSGPFPTEQLNEHGERLQTTGFEFGTTTGRKRRCGWLDLVLLRYSHMINDYSGICITKLDVLSGFTELPVCIGYSINGEEIPSFPANLEHLAQVEVKYKVLPGWNEDITQARSFSDLPKAAQDYISFIEEFLGTPAKWIGVGPGREAMIIR